MQVNFACYETINDWITSLPNSYVMKLQPANVIIFRDLETRAFIRQENKTK